MTPGSPVNRRVMCRMRSAPALANMRVSQCPASPLCLCAACMIGTLNVFPLNKHRCMQDAFSPDPHEVEEARQLVQAFEEHQMQGKGAFTFRWAAPVAPFIHAGMVAARWRLAAGAHAWQGLCRAPRTGQVTCVAVASSAMQRDCLLPPPTLSRDRMIDQPTYLQARNLLQFAARVGQV